MSEAVNPSAPHILSNLRSGVSVFAPKTQNLNLNDFHDYLREHYQPDETILIPAEFNQLCLKLLNPIGMMCDFNWQSWFLYLSREPPNRTFNYMGQDITYRFSVTMGNGQIEAFNVPGWKVPAADDNWMFMV